MNSEDTTIKSLQEMHDITSSSFEFNRMRKSLEHFCNYFGLNHFYYTRTYPGGNYSTLGLHLDYHEFIFDQHAKSLMALPCIRHPEKITEGVFIEQNTQNQMLLDFFEIPKKQFEINFTIAIRRKIPEGSESIGFGTKFTDRKIEEHLLNNLPIVYKFIEYFKNENSKLIRLAQEHQVEIIPLIGSQFYEAGDTLFEPVFKNKLFHQLGIHNHSMTNREIDILKYVSGGFSAKYIANQLHLSVRTVENYICTIKDKLNCHSKDELILKAKEITSLLIDPDLS